MPSYIAEGVLQPFRAYGVRVRFYRLHRDLQPDETDIEQLVCGDTAVRIVVIVHPLGYEAAFGNVRALAQSRGIYVLEDCAHALFSEYRTGGHVGSRGDFALFSLNKFLPVPDGAVLTSTRDDVNVELSDRAAAPPDREAIDHYLEHLHLNADLLHSQTTARSTVLLRKTGEAYDRYYARITAARRLHMTSDESADIRVRYDLTSARARRRANAEVIHSQFPDGPMQLLYPDVPPGVTCFAVPALVPARLRDAAIATGIARGVLFSTLVDRWNFVPRDSEERFLNEDYYVKHHLLIPVSEFLDMAAMQRIIEVLSMIQRALTAS